MLSGRLMYHYTQYKRLQAPWHKRKAEEALSRAIDEITSVPTIDHNTLREILLIDRLYQDTTVALPPLTTLDHQLTDRAVAGIQAYTLTGWYTAAVVSCHFGSRQGQTSVNAYLQQLTAAWNEVRGATGIDCTFSQKLIYQNDTPLGLEGMAGLLLMLISIERSVDGSQLSELIKEGVRYLLSFRQEVDFSQQQYNVFPSAITAQGKPLEDGGCLGWSTGDLPQALLLHQAATLFHSQELLKIGHLVGLNTLLREDHSLLVEGGELHSGSAGVAQLYHTLYQLSGHRAYYKGYKRWLRKTLNLTDTQLRNNAYAGQEYSMMHGLAGVYLTLLMHTHTDSQDWRSALLLPTATPVQ